MHFLKFAASIFMIASTIFLSACSKNDSNNKDDQAITATTPVSGEASTLTENNALQRLKQTLQANFEQSGIKAKIQTIRTTEIPNMYWVTLEGFPSVLASSDAKYIFQGDVIRLGDKKVQQITEGLKALDNKTKLAALKLEDLIVYPAQGKTKHIVYVFTDSSCPYCHKLHEHLNDMTSKGIEVRYIAWPRGEQFFATMQNIWCSADRKAAFDASVKGQPLQATQCTNPVMAQYQLGLDMGVNGTPAIYNQDGQYLGGYMTPDDLLERLKQPN